MKRLLLLVPTYEPFKDGVAEAAKVMANGLAGRGYQVTVGTGYHPNRRPDPPDTNPSIKQFQVSGTGSWREGFQGEVNAYRQCVASLNGEFIICHCWQAWTTDLVVPLFHSIPAKKIIVSHGFTVHMIPWHHRFPWGLGQWLGWLPYTLRMPFVLRRFSRVVFLSKRVDCHRFFDHWLARITGHPGIAIVPNSVDPSLFERTLPDFRAEFGIGGGLLFLCVANYCTRKNQALATRAFRKACLAGATLVFIGSEFNDYYAFVRDLDKDLSRSHPEGRVVFLEKVNRNQTLAAFKTCDVFVLASREETQPIVLMEAMASGSPFISTHNSGCITELNGGIVVDSEEQMTAAMKLLSEDSGRRQTLGQTGREDFLAKYTQDRAISAFDELLRLIG